MSPSALQDEVRLVEASEEMLSAEASCFDRARYELQFFKTKQCSFYAEGKCTRGDYCKYAHGLVEMCIRPDLTNTSLCRSWAETGVCGNPLCKFAHNSQQLRATDRFYKTSLCKFFLANACHLGEECRHAHGNEELRPTPAALPAPLSVPKDNARSKTRSAANVEAANCGGATLRRQKRGGRKRREEMRSAANVEVPTCGPPGLTSFSDETYLGMQWQYLMQQAPMTLDDLSLDASFSHSGFMGEAPPPLPYRLMRDDPEIPAKVCLDSFSAPEPAKVWVQSLSTVSTFDGLPPLRDPDARGEGSDASSSADPTKEDGGGYEGEWQVAGDLGGVQVAWPCVEEGEARC